MTFLQPFILFALPLIGLPILIHFVNQNRHRTVHWAATMFLLQARKMTKGIARLRYLLILLARMLVIAGLLFAISRPMSGGWLGLTAGGSPDTTIIILDRSSSMEEQDAETRQSKRQTALSKLSELIQNVGSATQLVLFDSATGQALKVENSQDLMDLPETESTMTTADIPALLQSVAEYVLINQTGRTDVWVCSDLRQSDWRPESGQWEEIRRQLQDREGIRFFLLSYADVARQNLAVSATGVHRRETAEGAELVMDLRINRISDSNDTIRVPVAFVIDGARSTLDVEITGNQLLKNGHVIPLDRESVKGWGRIELPADTNPADNVFSFVYADAARQKTVVVSDDPSVAEYFRIAAATSANRAADSVAEVISPSQAVSISWNDTSLVIWQAPIPEGVIAEQLVDFAASGRSIIFFPPDRPDGNSIFGLSWDEWESVGGDNSVGITRWRTDADLLSNSRSGTPLPVGQIELQKFCRVKVAAETGAVLLAQLDGGDGLLTRVATDLGAVYFCGTLPGGGYSSLISNGVVFYVMIQRSLAQGSGSLGKARQLDCSQVLSQQVSEWKPLDADTEATRLSRRSLVSGVFQNGEILMALNRPVAEDSMEILTDESLQRIFGELDYTRIDDRTGSRSDLASEVWRLFLLLMIVALLAEALLCIPERAERRPAVFRTSP